MSQNCSSIIRRYAPHLVDQHCQNSVDVPSPSVSSPCFKIRTGCKLERKSRTSKTDCKPHNWTVAKVSDCETEVTNHSTKCFTINVFMFLTSMLTLLHNHRKSQYDIRKYTKPTVRMTRVFWRTFQIPPE